MKLPARVAPGAPITAAGYNDLVAYARAITPRKGLGIRLAETPEGTVITATATASTGGAASSSSAVAPHPFEVVRLPLVPAPGTPAPTSGPLETLSVRLGSVNERVAIMAGDDPTAPVGEVLDLHPLPPFVLYPISTLMPGKWAYVYLRMINGIPRPRVSTAALNDTGPTTYIDTTGTVPEDDDENEYAAVAAVRATPYDAAGGYRFEVFQMLSDNLTHRFALPLECSLYSEDGKRLIDIKKGLLSVAVADLVSPSLFNDDSSFAGGITYPLGARGWIVPISDDDTSIWTAIEYPISGTRLAAADYGQLRMTLTRLMPAQVPWIVVAEKNNKPEAVRDAAADAAVPTEPPTGGTAAGGPQEGPAAMTPDEADEATRAKFNRLPTDIELWDPPTQTTETGVEHGMTFTRIVYRKKYKVMRNGQQVFSSLSSGLWYLNYVPLSTPEGAAARGAPGRAPGAQKNGDDASGDTYKNGTHGRTQLWSYHNWRSQVMPSGGGTVIQDGSHLNTITLQLYSEVHWFRGDGPVWAGDPADTTITTIVHTYGTGGGGESKNTDTDTAGSNPKGDRAGRSGHGGGLDHPTAYPPIVVAAKGVNGAPIHAPGPGVYVFEIARITADGRLEQRHIGDIVLHPACQVQTRTKPATP